MVEDIQVSLFTNCSPNLIVTFSHETSNGGVTRAEGVSVSGDFTRSHQKSFEEKRKYRPCSTKLSLGFHLKGTSILGRITATNA